MEEGRRAQDNTHPYRCVPCNITFQGVRPFLNHHRNVRIPHTPPIQCSECLLNYEHLTSLVRHIKDVHYAEPAQGPGQEEPPEDPPEENADLEEMDGGEENQAEGEAEADSNSDYSADDGENNHPIDLSKSAGRMVLNLRQTGTITTSMIQRCQEECFHMMQEVAASIRQEVKKFFIQENINTPASRAFIKGIAVEDPFQRIKTLKQQLNYFSKELGLVKPVTKFLDYRIDYRLNSQSGQYEPVRTIMSFEYIPVIESLTLAMRNARVRTLIETEQLESPDGVLRSYLDGRRCKDNPLISRHPRIIRLQLYWDDVEVCNPLGSKTSIHKIAAFYFSIQNLPAVESSQLSSIYLLALAYSEDLKGPGRFEKILAPFLSDLRKLESEQGVVILLLNEDAYCLRATLTTLCADTLAAHEILGFLSPSARCFCRRCMVTRAQFRANMNVVAERRTKETFEAHAAQARIPGNSTLTGVKKGCPLHLSTAFDATKDAVFDIFHDLLEGVAHWVVSLALRSFILKDKYFTLSDFNGRISAFNYGVPDIKNKPSANFTDESLKGSKLKQTGSQMWCLIRVFGFLVANVPEDDKNLRLVNLLQSILLIVFAESIRPDDIDRLERLIEEHHRLFQELHVNNTVNVFNEDEFENEEQDVDNPDGQEQENDGQNREINDAAGDSDDSDENNLRADGQRPQRVVYKEVKVHARNKLHHMTHLPDEIRDHGNLVRYWCARYEARHQIFSRYGSVCCNFINIVKSMAQMHQLSTLSGLLKTNFRAEDIELQDPVKMPLMSSDHRDILTASGIDQASVVETVQAAGIAGETFRSGLFVILDASAPTFALIQHLYVFNNIVYLIVLPWRTVSFKRRYCAYEVKCEAGMQPIAVRHDALPQHGALGPWNPWNMRTVHVAPRTIIF
ncbi:Zinc finger protein 605 [Frankliniella fusca]|nr:Zinc finger protein 605 [Frankliniella fusca]